ncbi:hypothetical protein [Mastigocladopsis repens]|uniref:hypothetical protein n=1 Tax=Mastigocladopsis repens TaxID=221287 RepID=UPI0002EEEEC1|nr:hypothetical protein [Mastigocladopsis repens]
MSNFISTSRTKPCPVCGDTRGRCRELRDDPNKFLCMTVTDGYSTPPGFTFRGLTKDGTWGVITRDMGKADNEARHEWISRWRHLKAERLKAEKERLSRLLPEPDRDKHIRNIFSQLSLFPDHRDDLRRRGLSDDLIKAGMFRSVVSWQKLDREVSHQLAGVGISGRSLTNFDSGYLVPVWNEKLEIVSWQLRLDNPDKDEGKYRWASSRFKKKRPNGPTSHLSNGELPLTYCLPITGRCGDSHISNFEVTNPQSNLLPVGDAFSLPQYIGLAEGILKPWIISQLRSQIVIGAAGGNFGSSPETFKRYLLAAKAQLGIDNCQLILWADAGAVLNKNVMRQYRRTYELVTRWGYTLRVAWWGQLDKSCADPDEYAGKYELLTWAQFEGLSRNPSRFWDDVKYQILKIKRLVRPHRGFQQQKRQYRQEQTATTIIYIPGELPTPDEYIQLGCPKIIYQGDERVSIWKEAVAKGWQHILDKSAPGLGKSHTAGSMKASEFNLHQLWYLACDHRNPTTFTVEQNFVDLPPRHNGLAYDHDRLTPMGQPFLVHPTGTYVGKLFPSNCHRTPIFRALGSKNVANIENSSNPICLSCHLYNACRSNRGMGFGYRYERYSVFGYSQVRAHPDSLPNCDDYEYSECGAFWDEASLVMLTRKKIEVSISDFNQMAGELAVAAPFLFTKLKPIFERLRFLLWPEEYGFGMLWANDTTLPTRNVSSPKPTSLSTRVAPRYGYNDTAIRQMLGEIPQDITDIISEVELALRPDLSFLLSAPDNIDASTGTKTEKITSRRINKLLRGQTYTEAKEQINQVLLNWLVPLLEVWANYIRGSFHFDKGILSVHLEDNRHREVATATKFNIYLDGTLDVRYLALKLEVGVENILVISQLVPSYDNLTVVHVTDMGLLGRDRRDSLLQRVAALRETITNKYLGLSVAIIERKAFAQTGDGYHFRDGRGINRFADVNVLVSLGIPYPNIGELAAEYQVLTGVVPDISVEKSPLKEENLAAKFSDLNFQEFVDSLVRAEILQESGRLRAHLRSEEELIYYFVGDFDVGFLQEELPGCKFQRVRAIEIDWRAAECGEQTKFVLTKAIARQILSGNEKPTQQDVVDEIAQALPKGKAIKQSRVSQIVKEHMSHIGGWNQLRVLIAKLLERVTQERGEQVLSSDESWLAKIYFPLLGEESPVEAIVNLIQVAQVVGTRFGAILQYVSLDVRSQLLSHAFAVMADIGVGIDWLVEELMPLWNSS